MATQDSDDDRPADDVSNQSTHGPESPTGAAPTPASSSSSTDDAGDPPHPVPTWTVTEPGADGGAYHSAYNGEVMPPPLYSGGRYQASRVTPPAYPPDPILPFIAPPVPRRRRSDWPVLVLALIVSAVLLAACCIAGYALYTSKGPFFS